MSNYIVNSNDLTSVAQAIRTKGGTAANLTFPSGFNSAIAAIPTGITPSGTVSITQNGTVDVTQYASANVNVSGGGQTPDQVISAFVNGEEYEGYYNQPVVLSDNIQYLVSYAFFYKSHIPSIHFPNNLSEISQGCCKCCSSLTTIDLSNCTYLESIHAEAFMGCSNVTTVKIPASVTSLGTRAFSQLGSAEKITFLRSTPASAQANCFQNLPTTCEIHVPAGSLAAYTSASNYPSSSTYTYVED